MSLAGKVAWVTGSNRGIGRASALALAHAGADLVLQDLTETDDTRSLIDELAALGRRAVSCQADVADPAAVEGVAARGVAELGRLDVVVANAAFSQRELLLEADLALLRRTLDVTLWGPLHTLRAAARQMIRQGQGGAMVVISSPHAEVPVPRSTAYNMAKAGVEQLCRTAALEWAPHRIRVNAIRPGWIDTPGERKFFSEQQILEGGARLPWGRLGRPDEIARGVVFLADPASDYVTGSILLIDGGIMLPWWTQSGAIEGGAAGTDRR